VLLLPAVPCFAFQLVLLMKCTMARYRPTCLLLSLIVVRIVIVLSREACPSTYIGSWRVFSCRFLMLAL
jgi:hypothetical protein